MKLFLTPLRPRRRPIDENSLLFSLITGNSTRRPVRSRLRRQPHIPRICRLCRAGRRGPHSVGLCEAGTRRPFGRGLGRAGLRPRSPIPRLRFPESGEPSKRRPVRFKPETGSPCRPERKRGVRRRPAFAGGLFKSGYIGSPARPRTSADRGRATSPSRRPAPFRLRSPRQDGVRRTPAERAA